MEKTPHYHLNIKGDILFENNSSQNSISFEKLTPILPNQKKRIALIDRDGVIVEKAQKLKYLQRAEDMKLIPGAPEAIQYLNKKGILVVLVTNQPGIYKRQFTREDLYGMTAVIQKGLGQGKIDAVFFCPHAAPTEGDNISQEEECLCRKPKPGMLTTAMKLYGIDKENAIMFGDFASDIWAARNAEVTAEFIATKHDEFEAMQQKIQQEYPEVFEKRQYLHLLEAVKDLF